jgi:hypothetical protein
VFQAEHGQASLDELSVVRLDLLITDFLMPEMTGAEFIHRARKMFPGLPAITATGYADMGAIAEVIDIEMVLPKPFQLNDPAHRVEQALALAEPVSQLKEEECKQPFRGAFLERCDPICYVSINLHIVDCMSAFLDRVVLKKEAPMDNSKEWKTEEYHNYDMHVRTSPRAVENDCLPGHGDQWDFTVRITHRGAGREATEHETATSDPDIFYSTQAIAENMGFLKGREIIEGRIVNRAGETEPHSRTL